MLNGNEDSNPQIVGWNMVLEEEMDCGISDTWEC